MTLMTLRTMPMTLHVRTRHYATYHDDDDADAGYDTRNAHALGEVRLLDAGDRVLLHVGRHGGVLRARPLLASQTRVKGQGQASFACFGADVGQKTKFATVRNVFCLKEG